MKEILIDNIDGKTIKFVGQEIGIAEQTIEFDDGLKRTFRLRAYAVVGGGLVAQIDYLTSCDSEQAGSIVEQVDSVDDLQNCFFVFEPEELLPKRQVISPKELDKRKGFSSRLSEAYEKLTNEILDQVEAYASEHEECEKKAETRKTTGGILGMFRGQG